MERERKKKLFIIAKRWAKSVLIHSEPACAFEELSEEDLSYIKAVVNAIANKITDEDAAANSNDLARAYFKKPGQ